jgi:hypothetical protein
MEATQTPRRAPRARRTRATPRPAVTAAAGDALAEHIRRLVDAAPPLTSTQRDRLALLLRSSVGGAT